MTSINSRWSICFLTLLQVNTAKCRHSLHKVQKTPPRQLCHYACKMSTALTREGKGLRFLSPMDTCMHPHTLLLWNPGSCCGTWQQLKNKKKRFKAAKKPSLALTYNEVYCKQQLLLLQQTSSMIQLWLTNTSSCVDHKSQQVWRKTQKPWEGCRKSVSCFWFESFQGFQDFQNQFLNPWSEYILKASDHDSLKNTLKTDGFFIWVNCGLPTPLPQTCSAAAVCPP